MNDGLIIIGVIVFICVLPFSIWGSYREWKRKDREDQINQRILDAWDQQERGTGTKFCTNCGAALTEGQNFCPNCGAPIAGNNGNKTQNTGYKVVDGNDYIICPQCGYKNNKDYVVCKECGYPLK